ncbi:murein transglycosylase domain-containing protein [Sulfurimonas sp. HSL-1716]|uniref:murein transglycosylase domain-containing protein n=1 Tax=Hydrocurvibacter sulfurireducens TaxID=3131937 RepID=UPI0031F74BE5
MLKKTLLFIALVSFAQGETFKEFQQKQMSQESGNKQEFAKYKKSQEDAFEKYKKAQLKAFEDYKKSLGKYWKEPKLSTKKEWVAYTPDKKTRTDVDFEKNTITLETIADSPEDAKQKLKTALARVVTIDNKGVQESDPLEKILDKIKKPSGVIDAQVKNEPILSNIIFDKTPTKNSIKTYVDDHVKNNKITVLNSKIEGFHVYSLNIPMPSDSMQKKAQQYYGDVKYFAAKERLNIPLLFAIMQTESSFNPRARSYIPAFGLMQIVPSSAGMDAYDYLYNERRLVSSSYLYNSTNNIMMGSAYLHLLYFKYLKEIKDPTSRLYCTIAAYNTGAGNIAWAFNKNKNLSRKQKYSMSYAAEDINSLSPGQVYNRLLSDLRFDEPKLYLKNVSKRMIAYDKIYNH